MDFTGYFRVLTGFYWVSLVLLGFTGFYWVLLGFTRFYLVLLGFTGLLLGFTGFLQGFTRLKKFLRSLNGFSICTPLCVTLWRQKGDTLAKLHANEYVADPVTISFEYEEFIWNGTSPYFANLLYPPSPTSKWNWNSSRLISLDLICFPFTRKRRCHPMIRFGLVFFAAQSNGSAIVSSSV